MIRQNLFTENDVISLGSRYCCAMELCWIWRSNWWMARV